LPYFWVWMVEKFDVVKAFMLSDSLVITIPVRIRERLGIAEGSFLRLTIENKKVILEVVK